jgi:hypothetical protein
MKERAMRVGMVVRGLAVAALAVLAGCGNNGGGGGGPLPTYSDFNLASTAPRACDTLTLSAAGGAPLDTITISGLPPDMAAIAVYLETVADQIGVLYPTGPVAGGQANFPVPVGPDADPDGGNVMLTVTDGTEACPAVPFTIDPLPPAAADYATYMADLAATMQEFLDLVARVFGTDYATLSAADAPPAAGLAPVFVAVKVFDAALKSPPDLETDADRELVVRLLTQADALGVLSDAIADLEQWLTDHGSFKVAAGPSSKPGSGGTAGARRAGEACEIVDPPVLAISGTERLSEIMSDPTLGDVSGGVDGFTTAMAGISSATGAVGLSGPTSALGALSTIVGNQLDFVRAAVPSAFTSLTFDAETPVWEDKSAPEPAWGNAQAHVASTPFNLAKATLENLLAAAELVSLPGWALTVLAFSYEDELDQALDDATDADGPLCITVPAQQWGPFDVTSSDWSTSEIIGDTITKKTHETYVPAMLGASEVRVTVRSDKFGGATIVANNFVTVEAKTVSISPISPKVDNPGDPVTLTVSVNAHIPEAVDFTPPAGVAREEVTHTYLGGGIHTYAFNTPDSETLFPAPFRVRSTSPVVPPTDFERAGSVNIRLNTGTLEITGERGCIEPGETVDLVATLTGFDDPDAKTVTWTESAGSTTTGTDTRLATYTAPGTLGTVTVRAETPVPGVGAEPAADEVEMEVADQCLRQFLAAFNQSQADGDPDCEGPLGSRTELGEEPIDVGIFPPEFTAEDFFLRRRVPEPEGPYFSGAPVTVITQSSFTEMIPVGLDTCATTFPFARAEVVLETTSDSAHWEIHYDNRGNCYEVGTVSGCNVGGSFVNVDHVMYLPIHEEDATYRLTMDLSCTLYPHFGGVDLSLSRYIDGGGFPQAPNGIGDPEIPSDVRLEFDCIGTPVTQTLPLPLLGSLGPTGTDLITIRYQGAPAGSFDGLTPEEFQENLDALDPFGKGPAPTFIFDMEVDVRLERLD